MSAYTPMKSEDRSPIGVEDILVDSIDMAQFVNPHDTDKRYDRSQLDCTFSSLPVPSGLPNGYMAPIVSRPGSDCRRPSYAISETRSSESSFESSSGCLTPCTPVSASSASSSRRQSMISPGNQHYYVSISSPSPISRSPRSKQFENEDHYSLTQPFTLEGPSVCSNITSFMTENGTVYGLDEEFGASFTECASNSSPGWQGHETSDNFLSIYEPATHTNTSTSLSMDMIKDFNSFAMASQAKDVGQQYVNGSQTEICGSSITTFETGTSRTPIDPGPAVRPLGAPFEYVAGKYEPNIEFVDDDAISNPTIVGRSRCQTMYVRTPKKKPHMRSYETPDQASLNGQPTCKRPMVQKTKNRKGDKKQGRIWPLTVSGNDKKHPCPECPYKFVRPEHLARHKKSKHDDINTKYYPCQVHDCMDTKTGEHKMIKARGDNLAPHYHNTHFSWGNSDKSGKNRRISLKESLEIGLLQWDERWSRFLEGRLVKDDQDHKGEWKMLGYSIRETRDTKLKDLIPTWEGPDDATLKLFDWRWKMLTEGTMDFETAMAVGHRMREHERRDVGILGVTMLESEEMGLKTNDPRWQRLLRGKMTIDESETLGVKQLNPAWLALQTKPRR